MDDLNEQPFEHESSNGASFRCSRSDFFTDISVTMPKGLPAAKFAADVAEMAAHHALNIHPDLNGFAGYDRLRFVITESDDGGVYG